MGKEPKLNFIIFVMFVIFLLFIQFTIHKRIFNYELTISEQEKRICNLENELKEKTRLNLENLFRIKDVTITAYSPCVEETDSTPNETALMCNPIEGYTCAVSRDLNYLLGRVIYIDQIGIYRVNDLMNKRFKKRVDLCLNKNEALSFGIKSGDIVIVK